MGGEYGGNPILCPGSNWGPISLSVNLYVDLNAIPSNPWPASFVIDRMLDVLAKARNGLVLKGKVIGENYIAYISVYDKMTIHIKINIMNDANIEYIVRRILEALAKAIDAKLEEVIVATY